MAGWLTLNVIRKSYCHTLDKFGQFAWIKTEALQCADDRWWTVLAELWFSVSIFNKYFVCLISLLKSFSFVFFFSLSLFKSTIRGAAARQSKKTRATRRTSNIEHSRCARNAPIHMHASHFAKHSQSMFALSRSPLSRSSPHQHTSNMPFWHWCASNGCVCGWHSRRRLCEARTDSLIPSFGFFVFYGRHLLYAIAERKCFGSERWWREHPSRTFADRFERHRYNILLFVVQNSGHIKVRQNIFCLKSVYSVYICNAKRSIKFFLLR